MLDKKGLPKSFYDLQIHRPKNKNDLASIAKVVAEAGKDHELDPIEREHLLIKEATKKKEEELKFWKDALSKMSERQDGVDDSMDEISVHPHYRKDIQDEIAKSSKMEFDRRPSPHIKDETSHPNGRQNIGPNDPVSRPTAVHAEYSGPSGPKDEVEFYSRRGLKSGVSKHQGGHLNIEGPINPNQFLQSNFMNAPRFDERLHYDANNNDINRQANKAYNQVNHIMFLGAARPTNDEDMDRLRIVQRNMANKAMLLDQIKKNQEKKLLEKERLRLEEERENERVRRDNEKMNQRLEEEKRKDIEKRKKFQDDNLQLIEEKKKKETVTFAGKSSLKEKSSFLGGIDATSKVLTEVELEDGLRHASGQMQADRERVRSQLQEDLFKEKEFMMLLPEEINKKISMIMNQQLDRMKFELNQGTNQLRDNILNLRAKAIELDEERRRAAHEVNKLRSHLAQIQYEDDIRTNEMLSALADDNLNRILPSSSRFNMPEALIRDYDEYNFPISQYESTLKMDGSEKIYSAGFFDNDFTRDLDGSNNVKSVSRRGNMYGDAATTAALSDAYKVEEIYNKNLMRDKVFTDSIDQRTGHFGLQDFLQKDLDDNRLVYEHDFEFKF